jgi:hypothetical protein
MFPQLSRASESGIIKSFKPEEESKAEFYHLGEK